MNMFKSGPSYTKLKTNLRLIVNRLKLIEKKRTEMALKARKEIADYIAAGKYDRARIRVEHIVREDYTVEAMEMLEMYADLLLARFGLIESTTTIDPGLEEALSSLIWATPRLQAEVPEFGTVSTEFGNKYGKEYANMCRQNSANTVNEKLIHKLSVAAPPAHLIEQYMVLIAESFKVPYEPDDMALSADDRKGLESLLVSIPDTTHTQPPQAHVPPPGAYYQPAPPPMTGGYPGEQNMYPPSTDKNLPPPLPSVPAKGISPQSKPPTGPSNGQIGFVDLPDVPNSLPSVPGSNDNPGGGGNDVNFDDLEKRFEMLKKKK